MAISNKEANRQIPRAFWPILLMLSFASLITWSGIRAALPLSAGVIGKVIMALASLPLHLLPAWFWAVILGAVISWLVVINRTWRH